MRIISLVLAFVLHGEPYRYVHEVLDYMRDESVQRLPSLNICIEKAGKATDGDAVVARIKSFQPNRPTIRPCSTRGLADWVARELKGRLVLHPRAMNAVKKSCYEDPRLIYDCLALLADEYRVLKLCDASVCDPSILETARQKYHNRMVELGVDIAPSISASMAGEPR